MDLSDIKSISTPVKGDRYTYNGENVPRVTEIISKMIHEDAIVQWANGLGFRHISYTETLNEAARIGTMVHSSIEHYLKDEQDKIKEVPSLSAFKKWWKTINEGNRVEILGQEEKLVCPYFGGTYDLLLKINGVIYLVDFKTSNHVTYKYYIQLAAYNYMLKMQGIQIGGVIILQVSKKSADYNEYVLNLSDPLQKDYFDLCERTFLALVYGYYHIMYLERGCKNGQVQPTTNLQDIRKIEQNTDSDQQSDSREDT